MCAMSVIRNFFFWCLVYIGNIIKNTFMSCLFIQGDMLLDYDACEVDNFLTMLNVKLDCDYQVFWVFSYLRPPRPQLPIPNYRQCATWYQFGVQYLCVTAATLHNLPLRIQAEPNHQNLEYSKSKLRAWAQGHQWVSEWVIKFNGLSRTADSEVHIVHISRVIIACTLKSLSSPT